MAKHAQHSRSAVKKRKRNANNRSTATTESVNKADTERKTSRATESKPASETPSPRTDRRSSDDRSKRNTAPHNRIETPEAAACGVSAYSGAFSDTQSATRQRFEYDAIPTPRTAGSQTLFDRIPEVHTPASASGQMHTQAYSPVQTHAAYASLQNSMPAARPAPRQAAQPAASEYRSEAGWVNAAGYPSASRPSAPAYAVTSRLGAVGYPNASRPSAAGYPNAAQTTGSRPVQGAAPAQNANRVPNSQAARAARRVRPGAANGYPEGMHPAQAAQPAYLQPIQLVSPVYVRYDRNGQPVCVRYAADGTPFYVQPGQEAIPMPARIDTKRTASPMPSAKRPKRKKRGRIVAACLIIAALIAAPVATVIIRPSFAEPLIEGIFGTAGTSDDSGSIDQTASAGISENQVFSEVSDRKADESMLQAQKESSTHERRLLAQCQGVDIYSPIAQDELTGVIMHQASYEWGQVMTTQVPEADMEKYYETNKPLRVNNKQTEGEWVDADMAHLYRETDDTEMDTSVDVGAPAGTCVYAPVTGEVIAVTDYDLYDETPDVRIHIRPDANPNLDVVLLHQTDPTVKAGDRVVAGETPISSVRDIAAVLTDIQLAFYTGTDGNHSHVQVNDLNNADYVAKYNLPV